MIFHYVAFVLCFAALVICGRQRWWKEAVIVAVPTVLFGLLALQAIAGGLS